jgi:hypothetical protein
MQGGWKWQPRKEESGYTTYFSGQDWLIKSCKRKRRVSRFFQEDKEALSSPKLFFRMLGVWLRRVTEKEVSDSVPQPTVYYGHAD